jgi:phospholipid/cholesterol/gamma-HCH transport system substrate-binding protein
VATSGFLEDARPPLAADIQALGDLSANLAADGDKVEEFLQLAPTKIDLITRTAVNGSWFNFFMCSYNGTITVPLTEATPEENIVRDPVSGLPIGEGITIPRTETRAEGCN